jgi:prepilin-type N-terminal cleavage/methylation domain-containing protein
VNVRPEKMHRSSDRSDRSSRSGTRGFTLLELMVVVVLIGTVASIALPKFKDLFEVNLKSSMRRMAGTVKFCFHEAIIKQATIRLTFDVLSGTYTPTVLATNSTNNTGEFVSATSQLAKPQTLPNGIFFQDIITPRSAQKTEDGQTFIMFYPTGYAEKAVIHLRDSYGRQYTLLVKPLTGGVRIFDGYVDFTVMQQTETPFGTANGSL